MNVLRGRRLPSAVLLTVLAAATLAAIPAAAGSAPVIIGATDPTAVPNSYIVVYKGDPRVDLAAANGITVRHRYTGGLNGFAGTMSREVALRLAADPAVAHVEQDRAVTPTATQTPVPNWGLDRVDQPTLPLNNTYTWLNNASNVRAYIIDTGIVLGHSEFAVNRATWGTNTTGDGINTDCVGHGTHLAAIVGGRTFGVAKESRLVAVKILPCGGGSGGLANAIAGVNWVTANHVKPAAAIFGASTSASPALDTAIQNSVAAGVFYALPAGNSNTSACNYSPGRAPTGFTIGATNRNDSRTSWSNHGTCLDAFAPGESITSAWIGSGTVTNTISGTSQAAAFATGVAVQYLAGNPTATPAGVTSALIAASTPSVINPGPGSPNRLIRTTW